MIYHSSFEPIKVPGKPAPEISAIAFTERAPRTWHILNVASIATMWHGQETIP